MGLRITIRGAEGSASEAAQEQSVAVESAPIAVAFVAAAETRVMVSDGRLQVGLVAPGIANGPPGPQGPPGVCGLPEAEDGSVLQYSEGEGAWGAGFRMAFRPALRVYVISES